VRREREQLRLAVEAEWIEYEPDGSAALVDRLVPFGFVQGGDGDRHLLAWDAATPSHDGEFPIYIVGARNESVVLAAPCLRDFFARALDPECEWEVLGELDDDPLPTLA
jgi:hypothetical protein